MAAHSPIAEADIQVRGRLAGRRMLVTGAASGIGRALARLFVRAGARVAALDRHHPEGLAVDGQQLLACAADITDARGVQQAADAFGGLDGVVNAAGIANTDWADAVALEDWKRVLDVDLPSGQRLQPCKQRSAYAASNAGVIAFSKCIAMEWAPLGRVNTLCSGAADTPMVYGGYSADALRTQAGPRYALERIGEPHEIALAALHLSSAESPFVTGIAGSARRTQLPLIPKGGYPCKA